MTIPRDENWASLATAITRAFVRLARNGRDPNMLFGYVCSLADKNWFDIALVTEIPCHIEWLDDSTYAGLRIIIVDLADQGHTALALMFEGRIQHLQLHSKDDQTLPEPEVEPAYLDAYTDLLYQIMPRR